MIIWIIILLALAAIFWFQVYPRLRSAAALKPLIDRLDALNAGWLTRLNARLATWRTVILGFLGTAFMALPDLLQQLYAAPWGQWVDEIWTRRIGAALYLAMIFTRINSPGPVGAAPVMPAQAPGTEVLVPEAKKTELVEQAKQEGKLDW